MSTNRRERRQSQRETKRHKRKLDRVKIRSALKWLLYGYSMLAVFLAIIFSYSAWSSNHKRHNIAIDPATTMAVIDQIHKTRNSNFATYTFHVSGQAYYGETDHRYNGVAGDTVYITYNRIKPSLNMLSSDMPTKTLKILLNDFGWMLVAVAGLFLSVPIIIGVRIFFGDKAAYNDISSKVK